ncbi:MAG: phosphoglucomutase/phosphomannomutase family protein [Deltaproteobacteria bacterium]|nr:phosphoglucomutase/phosphomannomutase family protein [Deltaproteobacteria bacterium]
MSIRFGTDGWRAVIGKDFTPENIATVIQAFADIYPTLPEKGRAVIVGFDRRNQSKESAELVARVLTANGIPTLLSKVYCPTPCVSWMVKNKNAAAGIMVTASHNPPSWNGIKFKESYGGAASHEWLAPIEAQIDVIASEALQGRAKQSTRDDLLTYFDPHKDYLDALRKLVDLNKIKKSGFKIMFDPLYGCGAGYLEELLGDQVMTIHGESDPNFGGLHPEPIRPYVDEAMRTMRDGNFSIGLINDGDADRIGCVDEKGNYVTTHEIYALLLKHVVENKKLRGKVLKSISTTVMIDRLCKKYDLPLETTPVGFKYLSPAMNQGGVLIGGEESGGMGLPSHICERDGLYCDLLLLELMADRGKTIGELVADLQKEVGPTFYRRIDLSLDPAVMEKAHRTLPAFMPQTLAGKPVKKITTIDGFHYAMNDESWLLIRLSGTEPLLRTYAEAPSEKERDALLTEAKHFVDSLQ